MHEASSLGVLPDQRAGSILNGHLSGTMPPDYVGGIGVNGAAALERFVEAGGLLLAIDQAAGAFIVGERRAGVCQLAQ